MGCLGKGENLRQPLASRGLHRGGGYMPLPLSDPARMEPAIAELTALLALFDSAKSPAYVPAPKPTLADARSRARRLVPGPAQSGHSPGVQPVGWVRRPAEPEEAG